MKTYSNLYSQLCSRENLISAFFKATQRKTLKNYVIEFESELEWNLMKLEYELKTFTYSPRALTTFTIRDPKTRNISASDFRDRVVHHALCNIIESTLSKSFIYDSFANQKGKGTHCAIKRFEYFMKKVSHHNREPKFAGGGATQTFCWKR